MIRFTTMVRASSENLKNVVTDECEYFIDINDETCRDTIERVLKQGVHYGYVKMQMNGHNIFEEYELQLFPLQWLTYIELLEVLLEESHVNLGNPYNLDFMLIEDDYLKIAHTDQLFVVKLSEFVEQFSFSAKQYLQQHLQQTQDCTYEEVIQYVTKLEQHVYSKKV